MHENRETSRTSQSNQERDRSAKAKSRKADMHVLEESDCAVVPVNQPNNEERSSAEVWEGRAQTKENIARSSTSPTQSGKRVSQGLSGVRQTAKERRQERFTALLHHLSVNLRRDSFFLLKRQAAPGVDGVTWKEYQSGLEEKLAVLHSQVQRGAYRAQPSRRVYIPKADGRQRRFLEQFQERLAKFGLELHSEKTRLIRFGRFAAQNRAERGQGKPETFTFLGFTHYCGKRRSDGSFIVWRKTASKRITAKLRDIKSELRRRMHEPIPLVGEWLKKVLMGYYQYHAIPGFSPL